MGRTGRGASTFASLAAVFAAASLLAGPAFARPGEAYIANNGSDQVSVLITSTGGLRPAIAVPPHPVAVAITPDGGRLYVVSDGADSVSVIDTRTNTTLGSAIPAGSGPQSIAIAPDGSRAYVVDRTGGNLLTIDTATNAVVGAPIPIGGDPVTVAITPDGTRAYVVRFGPDDVVVVDTASGALVGAPIPLGPDPFAITVTPDGSRAFVANFAGNSVSAIDTATGAVQGAPIPVGGGPAGIAVSPDGTRVYTADSAPDRVSVIDATANANLGSIPVGTDPVRLTFNPSGTRAFVVNYGSQDLSVIDTADVTTVGAPITVGGGPGAIAIQPDQGPTAAFTAAPAPAGAESRFDGSASSDGEGPVTHFEWDFGDGTQLAGSNPIERHSYANPGTYTVTLTARDPSGCSMKLVFTGQTAYCNGTPAAHSAQQVTVPERLNLALRGKRKQQLDRAIDVIARCNKACSAIGGGRLVVTEGKAGKSGRRAVAAKRRFKLKRAKAKLEPNEKARMKLKPPKRGRRVAAGTLAKEGKVTALITVTASHRTGTTDETRRKKLKATLRD